MSDDPEFPRDHNQAGLAAEVRNTIRLELAIFEERRDAFVKAADGFVLVRDRIDVGKATDIVGLGQKVGVLVEAERKRIAGPHYDAFRAVNEYVSNFWYPAARALSALTERIETFHREEDQRILDQQNEQRAHEASLRAAAAPVVEEPVEPDRIVAAPGQRPRAPAPVAPASRPVRGDFGYAARRRAVDVITIEDVSLLPDWIFQSQPVIDAIIATVKPLVAKKVPIPGIAVSQSTKTKVGT